MADEIDILLDASEIHLKAGDVLVQQGTHHAWVNRGTEPCRIAFVLVDAEEPLASTLPRIIIVPSKSRRRPRAIEHKDGNCSQRDQVSSARAWRAAAVAGTGRGDSG